VCVCVREREREGGRERDSQKIEAAEVDERVQSNATDAISVQQPAVNQSINNQSIVYQFRPSYRRRGQAYVDLINTRHVKRWIT